jgi:hypothetical protein
MWIVRMQKGMQNAPKLLAGNDTCPIKVWAKGKSSRPSECPEFNRIPRLEIALAAHPDGA